MNLGWNVGCDIVYIPRFQKTCLRTPSTKEKLFTKAEQENSSYERLAGMFAAKEAVMKAAGIPAGTWHKIEISRGTDGAPQVTVPKNTCSISISHDGDYAFAVAICSRTPQ